MSTYPHIRATSPAKAALQSVTPTNMAGYPITYHTKQPVDQGYEGLFLPKSLELTSISDDHQYAGSSSYLMTFDLHGFHKGSYSQKHPGCWPTETVSFAQSIEDHEQFDCDTASVIETDHETTSYRRHGTSSPSVLSVSDEHCQQVSEVLQFDELDKPPDPIAYSESHEVHSITRLLDWVNSVIIAGSPEGKQCKTDGKSGNPPSDTLNSAASLVNYLRSSSMNYGKRPLCGNDSEQDAD
jgi:hypothetical protein